MSPVLMVLAILNETGAELMLVHFSTSPLALLIPPSRLSAKVLVKYP